MRKTRALSGLLVTAAVATSALAADPISRGALLDLAAAGVDPALVERLVERDCVAFEVDAAALLELGPRVPREVLDAAISCREARRDEGSPPCAASSAPPIDAHQQSGPAAYDLSELRRVALVPLVLEGIADEALTSAFRDETLRRGVTFELLDASALAQERGEVDSRASLERLLPLARAAGAQALFLGSATTRSVVGNPALHIEVRLVETERGQVLWQGDGAAQGGAFGIDQRRRIAARNVVRRLPW